VSQEQSRLTLCSAEGSELLYRRPGIEKTVVARSLSGPGLRYVAGQDFSGACLDESHSRRAVGSDCPLLGTTTAAWRVAFALDPRSLTFAQAVLKCAVTS
jgi:hypothetical protein